MSGTTPLTFKIIKDSSQRGKEILVDSLGYKYGVRRHLKTTVHWQCTILPKSNPYGAKFIQTASGSFNPGPKSHNHAPHPGTDLVAKIKKRVKEAARIDIFKLAQSIVDKVSAYLFVTQYDELYTF